MSDPVNTSFDAADASAASAISALPTEQVAAQVVEPSVVEPPKPISLKDEDLIELPVQGQSVTKTWKDARAEMMLHADYTRKRQEEAARVKVAEDQVKSFQEREAKIAEALQNRQIVTQLYQRIVTAQEQQQIENPAVPQVDPQVIFNAIDQRVNQAQTAIEARHIKSQLDTELQKAVSKFPSLKDVEGAERVIWDKVVAMNPQTQQEAAEAFGIVAKGMADRLEASFTERIKQHEAKRSKAKTSSLEPSAPGVRPSAKQFKGFDDPELHAADLALMESLIRD